MNENLKDDLLVGAKAIAEDTGLTQRQVFYAAQTKSLPIFRLGTKLAARRSSLRKRIAQLECEAA
jgi:hypothetical protein